MQFYDFDILLTGDNNALCTVPYYDNVKYRHTACFSLHISKPPLIDCFLVRHPVSTPHNATDNLMYLTFRLKYLLP